jgi:tetratricopeptide (TPR) repeat protein
MKIFSIISRKKNEKKTETNISEDIKYINKLEKDLKKSKKVFLRKLLKKVSTFEERTKQLDKLEKNIDELKGLLVGDKEKDAKAIFEFISKSPKRKLEKIAILAGIARSIPEPHEIEIPPGSVITHAQKMDLTRIDNRLKGIERRVGEYKRCLFSVDTRLEDNLKKNEFPEDLRDIFKNNGFLLPENVPITKGNENEWIIADKFIIRKENGELNVYFYIEEIKREEKEAEEMGLFSALARVISELNALREGFLFLQSGEKDRLRELVKGEISSLAMDRVASELDRSREREDRMHEGGISGDEVRIQEIHEEERGISEETEALYQEAVDLLKEGEGIKLVKKGKNEKAYVIFDRIILTNPNLKGAWLNKGVAAGRLGRRDEERYCYTEAFKIDRHYDKAIHNLEYIQ